MVDFGLDLSCVNDLSPDGRTVTGNMLVAEAIARRLITPRGRLIRYPNYGFDLTDYINADLSARDIASLRASVEAECLKDERIDSADVEATLESDGTLEVTIALETGEGPFTLVLSVSDVTIEILSVTPP